MQECPRCHRLKLRKKEVLNVLSRRDYKTYICWDCGVAEAVADREDFTKRKLTLGSSKSKYKEENK